LLIHIKVMYWTACEMFNRILQRRKYLCRSRALHIGLNLGIIEEWVCGPVGVGLPREVGGHFRVVRELVTWLQVGDLKYTGIIRRLHVANSVFHLLTNSLPWSPLYRLSDI